MRLLDRKEKWDIHWEGKTTTRRGIRDKVEQKMKPPCVLKN